MGLIAYGEADAAAFAAGRHLDGESLAGWRDAIGRYWAARAGMRLVDLGSGTGSWAAAFSGWWTGLEVVAVEPSTAMRERSVFRPVHDGHAAGVPVGDASVDAVWMSTVIHHVPDLGAAARELRRVLRPGAPVLIRSAFAGRHDAITLFRYFPEAVTVLDGYPSAGDVSAAFAAEGFGVTGYEAVPQVTARSLGEAAAALRREAHTPLQLISDEAYVSGMLKLQEAAETVSGPVIDALDLLVLRCPS